LQTQLPLKGLVLILDLDMVKKGFLDGRQNLNLNSLQNRCGFGEMQLNQGSSIMLKILSLQALL
jgi:hypothetical protein